MKIYFIRHGETDWNVEKRTQGVYDIELNDNGRNQVHKTGIYLRDYRKLNPDVIYSSPLKRARETSEIISSYINYDKNNIIYNSNLVEKYYGIIDGKTEKEVNKLCQDYLNQENEWKNIKDPILRIEKLKEHEELLYTQYGLEKNIDAINRCKIFMDELNKNSYETVIIVSHGGLIKCFMKYLFNLQWELPYGKLLEHGNCAIMLVEQEKINDDDYKYIMKSSYNNEHIGFIK